MDFRVGPVHVSGVQRYNEVTRKPVKADAPKQAADQVDVSESSRLFAQALAAVRSAPDVRAERVEAVRSALQNGTYEVNSKLVAEKILGLL
ncbi:MAG: flagellar biosynthesis anti-sigma factor FlgM [Oscillospiraceae bacterium]|nr:flagellar biosynthesis anti-sigma factor FlgM [Oscillospiraceae bacterium]